MISPNTCTAVKEALLHVHGLPGARLIQSSSTLASSHWRTLCLIFESADQTLALKVFPRSVIRSRDLPSVPTSESAFVRLKPHDERTETVQIEIPESTLWESIQGEL
jgi:hypothetical protein